MNGEGGLLQTSICSILTFWNLGINRRFYKMSGRNQKQAQWQTFSDDCRVIYSYVLIHRTASDNIRGGFLLCARHSQKRCGRLSLYAKSPYSRTNARGRSPDDREIRHSVAAVDGECRSRCCP